MKKGEDTKQTPQNRRKPGSHFRGDDPVGSEVFRKLSGDVKHEAGHNATQHHSSHATKPEKS